MGIDGGFHVRTAAVNQAAAAAKRVADGVTIVGDAVPNLPTTPARETGDWQLGDRTIDLLPPWDHVLHLLADELRALGQNLAAASLHYTRTDDRFGATFDGIRS